MTESVQTAFGVPVYNHASKLREALESLLLQTRGDFRIIVSDDNSTDETPAIVQEYVERHPRIIYHRTEQRLGYIGNARHCFGLARKLFPQAPYFAWASDHDIWHPCWLAVLTEALESHPDAVLACPRTFRIHGDGTIVRWRSDELSTVGETGLFRRFVRTFNGMQAGNMVYGLFRADALDRAGILRPQLLPDRLLLTELSFYGTMITVPQHLWHRRYFGIASIDRQIRASFLVAAPAYLKLPWWVAHSGFLFHEFAIRTRPDRPFSRGAGAGCALLYGLLGAKLVFRRWITRTIGRKLAIQTRMGALAKFVRTQGTALGRLRRTVNRETKDFIKHSLKRLMKYIVKPIRKNALKPARLRALSIIRKTASAITGPIFSFMRRLVGSIPGQPHRGLRHIYAPIIDNLFRQQKNLEKKLKRQR